jgi:hypothetical protein
MIWRLLANAWRSVVSGSAPPPDGRRDLAVFIDGIVLANPSPGLPFCLWVNSVFAPVGFGALLQTSGSGCDRPSKCEP